MRRIAVLESCVGPVRSVSDRARGAGGEDEETMLRNVVIGFATLLPLPFWASCAGLGTPPPPPGKVATTSTAPPERGPKGVEAGDVSRSVDPCTDFYEFANGAWRANNPIPPSKPKWSRRVASHDANGQRLQAILEDVSSKPDWPVGSVERLLGDHFASCMDEGAIDAAGVTPLAPLLADIDAARSRADVGRLIRRLHDLAIGAPFGATGAFDNQEPSSFLTNVVAGGLGLPDREHYLSAEPRLAAARDEYKAHVARVLALGGMPAGATREAAEGVVALEKRLAEASLDAKVAADPAATEHKMTFAQLALLTPSFDWAAYFDEAKIARGSVNVAEPKFMQQVDKELSETPIAVWKAYLAWHLLASASPWLSKPFADEAFRFEAKALGGPAEPKPRAARCVESTDALFGEALGKKYVERYFSPAAKAKAQEIARTLLAVLEEDVASVPWMTGETKKKAKEKLATAIFELGYPDRWKDHSALTLRRDAFWSNVAQGRRFNVDDARRQMGKPTDRHGWVLPPSSASAYLDPQLNELVLPAGFLQPPFFDPAASDAVNYGAMGAGLAHDMTHAVDATGAELDPLGRSRSWWTDTDKTAFQKRAQCVSDQYEGYFIEPGVHHQGKKVLNEAIADLGGLHLAYLALQRSMKTRPVPTIDGFTPAQQFFLAWGQFRGEAVRLETQREIVQGDPHPVPKFRVIGPLSNLPEFQEAFSCKAGAPMVRSKETRCTVW
jgi:putative endopeptidase